MILSDEPGYYRAGEYGIRLENLIVVEKREIDGAEREMLGFETLTLAPFDLALVEPKLSERRGDALAQRLSRARARGIVAASRRQDAQMADAGDAAAVTRRFRCAPAAPSPAIAAEGAAFSHEREKARTARSRYISRRAGAARKAECRRS